MSDDPQVVWHEQAVSRLDRQRLNGHRGCVVWFTGLSGSGKSTIANMVDRRLYEKQCRSYLLDGDNVRHGLCAGPNMLAPVHGDEFAKRFGLGFGAQDREENIRRVGALTELLASSGMIWLTAFVSPFRRDRELARDWVEKQLGPNSFFEIYVNTPLEVCISRDPKGLYQQAISGKIKNFTGISDPYEAPLCPALELKTTEDTASSLASLTIQFLHEQGVFSSKD